MAQGLLGAFIFYNWGLGWYKYLSTTISMVLGVFLLILQMIVSYFWLKKFKHGPAEYLWRKLTWIGFDQVQESATETKQSF